MSEQTQTMVRVSKKAWAVKVCCLLKYLVQAKACDCSCAALPPEVSQVEKLH